MKTSLDSASALSLGAEARDYFQRSIAPRAAEIDAEAEVLAEALRGLGDRQLLALRVSQNWGGAGLDEASFQRFQMDCARHSGALAFLQTQHQTAGKAIAASQNSVLKQAYLPEMASGKRLVGIGISHLRRPGKPLLAAIPVDEGYLLSGTVPWITGWGILKEFVIGANLPSGEELYGIVPLVATPQAAGGTLDFSPPLALSAMNSTQTVVGTLENWYLARDRVVAIKPADAFRHGDRNNVLSSSFLALGCAQAGLDILQRLSQAREIAAIAQARAVLQTELDNLIEEHFTCLDPTRAPYARRLQLRGSAIDLAGRCARAAAIAASGAANVLSHPAQRVHREALLFSVSGQTADVMAQSLARLLPAQPLSNKIGPI